jgi:hypothetical protein
LGFNYSEVRINVCRRTNKQEKTNIKDNKLTH